MAPFCKLSTWAATSLILTLAIHLANSTQIVSSDYESFYKFWNSTIPFESAASPEDIGLTKLAGSNIWYLKSYQHTDLNIRFEFVFDIPKWICRGTEITISIRYFSTLAPVTLWPVEILGDIDRGSNYATLEDSNEGWTTFVKVIDFERSEQILINGDVLPMGHIVFDEIILLYTDGDCSIPTTTFRPTTVNQTEATTQYQTFPTSQPNRTTILPSTTPTTSTTDEYPLSTEATTQSDPTTELSTPPSTYLTTDDLTTIQEESTGTTEELTSTYTTEEFTSTPRTTPGIDPTEVPVTEEILTTQKPQSCPQIPDLEGITGPPIMPNEALANFIGWKIRCFFGWVTEQRRLTEVVTVADQGPFRTSGEVYDLNTTIRNLEARGFPSYFTTYNDKYLYTGGNLNGGYFTIMLGGNPRGTINVTGTYESVGSVLSIMPFAANGTLTWSGSDSYIDFNGRFTIDNGYIVLNNQSTSSFFGSFSQQSAQVSAFEDASIPPGLMKEFGGLASAQILSRIGGFFKDYTPRLDKSFHLALFEYLSQAFSETDVLKIIQTPAPPPTR